MANVSLFPLSVTVQLFYMNTRDQDEDLLWPLNSDLELAGHGGRRVQESQGREKSRNIEGGESRNWG